MMGEPRSSRELLEAFGEESAVNDRLGAGMVEVVTEAQVQAFLESGDRLEALLVERGEALKREGEPAIRVQANTRGLELQRGQNVVLRRELGRFLDTASPEELDRVGARVPTHH